MSSGVVIGSRGVVLLQGTIVDGLCPAHANPTPQAWSYSNSDSTRPLLICQGRPS